MKHMSYHFQVDKIADELLKRYDIDSSMQKRIENKLYSALRIAQNPGSAFRLIPFESELELNGEKITFRYFIDGSQINSERLKGNLAVGWHGFRSMMGSRTSSIKRDRGLIEVLAQAQNLGLLAESSKTEINNEPVIYGTAIANIKKPLLVVPGLTKEEQIVIQDWENRKIRVDYPLQENPLLQGSIFQ